MVIPIKSKVTAHVKERGGKGKTAANRTRAGDLYIYIYHLAAEPWSLPATINPFPPTQGRLPRNHCRIGVQDVNGFKFQVPCLHFSTVLVWLLKKPNEWAGMILICLTQCSHAVTTRPNLVFCFIFLPSGYNRPESHLIPGHMLLLSSTVLLW